MNNIKSISQGKDCLTLKYENSNCHAGVISLGGFTQPQSVLFNQINNMITTVYNAGKDDIKITQNERNVLFSQFCLESIKFNEKKKEYVFGGTFKVNTYTESYPYAYAVPKEILPEVLEELKGEAYEIALLKKDIATSVIALFESFDIETLINVKDIPILTHGQLSLPLGDNADHSKGLEDLINDITHKRLEYA